MIFIRQSKRKVSFFSQVVIFRGFCLTIRSPSKTIYVCVYIEKVPDTNTNTHHAQSIWFRVNFHLNTRQFPAEVFFLSLVAHSMRASVASTEKKVECESIVWMRVGFMLYCRFLLFHHPLEFRSSWEREGWFSGVCVFHSPCLILITSICLSVKGKRFIFSKKNHSALFPPKTKRIQK